MAKLSDLIPVVSRELEIPEETIAIFARHLRLARLISTGGRGRGAPDMTPTDCTNLVIASLSGMPAKDAAEAVSIYRNLRQTYVDFMRDEDAPRIDWIDELKGATLGEVIDRLIASATTDEFDELGRLAMTVQTHNWYVLVNVRSPKPGGEIVIGAGSPIFSGELRKHNTIIAALHFNEGIKKVPPEEAFDFEDEVAREKFFAAQRGWTSDRVRTEQISRGTLKRLGELLKH